MADQQPTRTLSDGPSSDRLEVDTSRRADRLARGSSDASTLWALFEENFASFGPGNNFRVPQQRQKDKPGRADIDEWIADAADQGKRYNQSQVVLWYRNANPP